MWRKTHREKMHKENINRTLKADSPEIQIQNINIQNDMLHPDK